MVRGDFDPASSDVDVLAEFEPGALTGVGFRYFGCDDVDHQVLWNAVQQDVPALVATVAQMLKDLDSGEKPSEAAPSRCPRQCSPKTIRSRGIRLYELVDGWTEGTYWSKGKSMVRDGGLIRFRRGA